MELFARGWVGPRVLVVDDDPVSAKVMKRLFAAHSIEVDTAPNGRVALEMYRNNRYRLILSDWMMPEMNGVELCKAFRELEGPYTYFLLCSSQSEKEDRMEAYEAGVDDFLKKPLDPDEFYARLTVARRLLSTEDVLQNQNDQLEETAARLEESNESLTLASRRFEALFNGLPVACFTFDEFGDVREWNRVATEFFGFPASETFERPIWDVFDGVENSPWTGKLVDDVFRTANPPAFDWMFRRLDGSELFLACVLIALNDSGGKPIGAVCANIDITERKMAERRVAEQMEEINDYAERLREMNEKLNHLAVTDGLTGLWNHRRFQEALDDTIESHARSEKPFSLLLLDIDHFKRFNDDFGHQTGDAVLRSFAQRLRDFCRQHEFPARYGGEEFAIILHDTDHVGARKACERLMAAMSDLSSNGRVITSSIGATTAEPGVRVSTRGVVSRADVALYHSKQTGRNRFTHYDDISAIRQVA